MRKYPTIIPLLILAMAGSFASSAGANNLQLRAHDIQAGMLYNFLKYTEWPPASLSTNNITICIFGDDPFDGALTPLKGRSVNQRVITIRSFQKIEEVRPCHLLFINGNEKGQWPELRKFLAGSSILTVSDFPGFATSAGGMIEFGYKESRISVALNLEPLKAAQLRVQERLLKLVKVVQPSPEEGE